MCCLCSQLYLKQIYTAHAVTVEHSLSINCAHLFTHPSPAFKPYTLICKLIDFLCPICSVNMLSARMRVCSVLLRHILHEVWFSPFVPLCPRAVIQWQFPVSTHVGAQEDDTGRQTWKQVVNTNYIYIHTTHSLLISHQA